MAKDQPTTETWYDSVRTEAVRTPNAFTVTGAEPFDWEELAARPKPSEHPLLGHWGDYHIRSAVWYAATPDEEASLEIELRSATGSRRFRFLGAQGVRLDLNGRVSCHDTRMLDVSCRGEERWRVEVSSVACCGPIHLYAREVVELPT